MTITFVGSGTSATGNNASVTPVAHASTAAGDLVLVCASIRNSGTGTVNVPTGWTRVDGTANITILGRIWEAGDVIPAITFANGVANADTIAQTVTFRGVEPRLPDCVGATNSRTNSSAQNIDYTLLDVPGAAHAVLLYVWKQDDNTGVSTPAGFTAGPSTSTTTGDDASQAIKYQIQTTEADISSGTLTVTGGGSAISRAIIIALRPAAAIAVQTQAVYPSRVLVSVTGLTVGVDEVQVVRTVGGEDTVLRSGVSASPVTDTSYLVVDAELPFGVPVTYAAIVNGTVRYETSPTTYTLTGGKVALTDAITGVAAETVILAWNELAYDRQSTVYKVGARNVVVSGDLGQWEADITFYMESDSSQSQMLELLDTATGSVMQIRQPGGYAGVDSYVAVTAVKQSRFSQDGTDPRRTWTLHCVQVDGWASTLEASGYTLQDIYDFYGASGTLADLNSDFTTLLDIAQAAF